MRGDQPECEACGNHPFGRGVVCAKLSIRRRYGYAYGQEFRNFKKIINVPKIYERVEITKTVLENTAIEIVLEEKGTYGIKMSQTNMFGTISDESAGVYSYKYE